jgi:hypothetical protein
MTASSRKIFKAIAMIFLLLVICLLFAISFLSLEKSRNQPLNDSDLIFTRPQIPVESNAYYTLLKATNELYWPASQESKLRDMTANTNWNDSLAADVLEKNQVCLDSFDEAMQQPFLLAPEISAFDEDISYLEGWRQLCNLNSIQIFFLHRAKKDKEAFDRAVEIIKFGQRVENSGGPIIHYTVGSGVKSGGLWSIRQMLADTTLGQTDLVQAIGKLNGLGPNREGLTNALKLEYEIQRNLVDDFAAGKIPDTTNSAFVRAMTSAGMKAFLNAKKTKMEFAQGDRFLFGYFSKPYAEIPWSNRPNMNIETNDDLVQRLASGNAVGDGLYTMVDWSLESLAKGKSREAVNVTATQLLLALKIYKMQHGKLPDSLSELIPEFFPQVPLDDFDGKPFRYLPDKKIIYSVGPCLKDLDGIEPKNYSADYNLLFKIEF